MSDSTAEGLSSVSSTSGDAATSGEGDVRREAATGVILRLVALVVVLGGLYLMAKLLGWTDYMTPEALKDMLNGAGNWGLIAFIGIYCFGVVAHVPGLVFVVAAVVVYGVFWGAVIGLLTGVVAVTLTFIVVRAIGGRPLSKIKHPFALRILGQLDKRPLRSVIVLRLVFIMAPGVNYGLALSSVRLRDYILGSAIGLTLPVIIAAFVIDAIM